MIQEFSNCLLSFFFKIKEIAIEQIIKKSRKKYMVTTIRNHKYAINIVTLMELHPPHYH